MQGAPRMTRGKHKEPLADGLFVTVPPDDIEEEGAKVFDLLPGIRALEKIIGFPGEQKKRSLETGFFFERHKCSACKKRIEWRTFHNVVPEKVGEDFEIKVYSEIYGEAALKALAEAILHGDNLEEGYRGGDPSYLFFMEVMPVIRESIIKWTTPIDTYDPVLLKYIDTVEDDWFDEPSDSAEFVRKIFEANQLQEKMLESGEKSETFTRPILDIVYETIEKKDFWFWRHVEMRHDRYCRDGLELVTKWIDSDSVEFDDIEHYGEEKYISFEEFTTPGFLEKLFPNSDKERTDVLSSRS